MLNFINFSIIAQILALFYNIYAMSKNKQSKMMLHLFIANALNMLVYISSKNYGATLIVFGTMLRCLLFTKKEKNRTNTIFFIVFAVQLIIGIISFKNISSILTIFSSLFACYVSWFLSPQGIRKGLAFTDTLWVIYNISCGLYIQSFNCFIGLTSKLFFILKNKEQK